MFSDEQRRIQVDADKDGVQPVWPSLSIVCRLAMSKIVRRPALREKEAKHIKEKVYDDL